MPSSVFFVRALYDFDSVTPSSLSFRKNDIIQVLTQLESGWWDGLCNGQRGWFPSNYVAAFEEEEGEEEGEEISVIEEKEVEEGLNGETDAVIGDNLSDWVVQHTPDGVAFYLNIRTGESTWEPPVDDEDDDDVLPDITKKKSTRRRNTTSTISTKSIHNRISSSLPDSINILTRNNRPLPENWIQQPTEDGSTYYYYNVQTQEIRWTHPSDSIITIPSINNNGFSIDEDGKDEIDSHMSSIEKEGVVNDDIDNVDAADEESIASSRGSRLSTSTIGTIQQRQLRNSSYDDVKLPPNWSKRTTSQGRDYYYNQTNKETTWSLENIDATGKLIKNDDNENDSNEIELTSDYSEPNNQSNSSEPLVIMMQNPNELLNWDSLLSSIILSVQQLHNAAKENAKYDFVACTNSIVESIRIMLYASGTIDKESRAIRENKNLKMFHRRIMASLSKLVLSTKIAAGVWPPPDSNQKLRNDVNEVIEAVQQFIQISKSIVEIRRVDPRISLNPYGGSWRGNNLRQISTSNRHRRTPSSLANYRNSVDLKEVSMPSQYLTHDLVDSIDRDSKVVFKTIDSLMATINDIYNASLNDNTLLKKINSDRMSQLSNQVHQVIKQAGHFLSMLEDVDLKDLDEYSQTFINEFEIAKQFIYDSIASLLIAIQVLAGPLEELVNSTNVVRKSIKDVIIALKFLLEEKETRDQNREYLMQKQHLSSASYEKNPTSKKTTTEHKGQNVTTINEAEENENGDDIDNNGDDDNDNDDDKFNANVNNVNDNGINNVNDGDDGDINEEEEDDEDDYDNYINNSKEPPQSPPSLTSESSDYLHESSPPLSPVDGTHNNDASKLARKKNKVSKFFGEEVLNEMDSVPKPKEEKQWFLEYDYDPSEIIFNMEDQVKGGTLKALIERLTSHDKLDSNFIATFLLTYRSFCTTDEFFDHLVARFVIEPPERLTPEELEVWREKKQKPVRLRVFNIMKTWLETYYIDGDDGHCLERIREFANTTMNQHMSFATNNLIKIIDKRQLQPKQATFRDLVPTVFAQPPSPILPRNLRKINFLNLDPLEIARQLTIIESKLYNKIRPVECLNKAWSSKEEGDKVAVNIKAMILNSNQITGWVAETILNVIDTKKRCSYIKHFVSIADKCRSLNNFNSLTAIISGLNSAPVHRLRRTWEIVNTKTLQALESLNRLMNPSKSFAEYRVELHSINPPCIPFLGVYLTDLTFIEDGNSNTLKNNNKLINFSKRIKTADIIREIQQYQFAPYNLSLVEEIQEYLTINLENSKNVADLYEQSLSIEPREREDEKIARLLQESGFL